MGGGSDVCYFLRVGGLAELAQRLNFHDKVGPIPFLIVGYWNTDNLDDLRFSSNLFVFLGLLMVTDLNAITPQTWLAQMFKDVVARIRGLGLNQSTKIAERANRLDASAKEQFIAHFESFWFTMKAMMGIIDDLLHAAWRLEALKVIGSQPIATLESSGDVAAYTASLYEGLYRLIEIIAKLKWGVKEDIKKRFPELHFVWLLRNNFLVHPKAQAPLAFENVGRATSFPHDERLLPYVVFGPQGFGWTFYFQFHAAKADIDFEAIDVEQVRKENKERFTELRGWDAVAQDEQLLSRIKVVGLAPVDQQKLAEEFRRLFEEVISPRLEAEISEAESRGVFIRSG